LGATVAATGAEYIAREAFGVKSDEKVLAIADVAEDERYVLKAVWPTSKPDSREVAHLGWQGCRHDGLDQRLVATPEADEFGD
jgi:hypothetical protein